ncbi:hypothetical protein SCHPADRAFT_210084 [Schizopora paradoxa]|uniref:Uncharacterized protein n=1 Tax=Schizopora paradoxa TaxID=27342 RepID=A0A0H2SHI1_9AGAM|nr:hypothetical protein SCHPADRAFT_210084 [Schizopora paradoxa]
MRGRKKKRKNCLSGSTIRRTPSEPTALRRIPIFTRRAEERRPWGEFERSSDAHQPRALKSPRPATRSSISDLRSYMYECMLVVHIPANSRRHPTPTESQCRPHSDRLRLSDGLALPLIDGMPDRRAQWNPKIFFEQLLGRPIETAGCPSFVRALIMNWVFGILRWVLCFAPGTFVLRGRVVLSYRRKF